MGVLSDRLLEVCEVVLLPDEDVDDSDEILVLDGRLVSLLEEAVGELVEDDASKLVLDVLGDAELLVSSIDDDVDSVDEDVSE